MHAALSPYLFDAGGLADQHLVIGEESGPINGMGKLVSGTQPIDDGNYIFDEEERTTFLEAEPGCRAFPASLCWCSRISARRRTLDIGSTRAIADSAEEFAKGTRTDDVGA